METTILQIMQMSPSSWAEIGCLGIVGLDVGMDAGLDVGFDVGLDVGGGIVEGVDPGGTTAAGGVGFISGVSGFVVTS